MIRRVFGTVSAVAWLLLSAATLSAQGVTGAAVRGTVTDNNGQRISGAVVTLVNSSTGQRYETRSAANGRFNFENAEVGGPYTLTARSIGYQPSGRSDITLTLGQAVELPIQMTQQAVQLEAITVTGQELQNPVMSSSHTGAAGIVTQEKLAALPTIGRNFTDFIATIPQVVSSSSGSPSIGGQNNRFNNIQIDGGVNNDLFGLAGSGTPGGQASAKPISIEAVREYQVLIAPFDVRQGGFTGGLVNAVTKSGSNTFHGSVFGYFQDEAIVGKDTAGNKFSEFSYLQYGLSLSGPIVRDKLHFFFSTDLQSQSSPYTTGAIRGLNDSIGVGITGAYADRVRQIAQQQYNFDPGTWQIPTRQIPDRNFFAKLNAHVGNGEIELSNNYVNASSGIFARPTPPTISTTSLSSTGYQLSNSGYIQANTTNTTRGKWITTLGGVSNELLLGYSVIRDHRDIPNFLPHIFVGGENPARFLSIGGEPSSQANLLNQDIFEITDNVTKPIGAHRITLGTHNEVFKFHNLFQQGKIGIWTFNDTTAFKTGTPSRYLRSVSLNPLRPEGAVADFGVRQLGGYIQDSWSAATGLTVTLGVRADVPLLDEPVANPALQSALAINNSDFPSGRVLFSPRVGFNYDVRQGQTVVRGGAGLFTGRPPYVWVSNAFVNTGLEQATLTCVAGTASGMPAFTVDPDNQPTTCGVGGAATPTPGIVYFDPAFNFPQTARFALGMDQRLVAGVTGTVDFVYTRWRNQLYIDDANLQGIQGTQAGEGGRARYGTFNSATGGATALRKSTSFAEVLHHYNASGDRSWSITGQLQRQVGKAVFNVGYTYSNTKDLMSLTSSVANSNFQFATLDGTLANRNLRTSFFDAPHKISASGTVRFPLDFTVGIFYIGRSGPPYAYTVNGDANADGKSGNDLIYVPRDQNDISLFTPAQWSTLDTLISREPCLNSQRGQIMERNSCRNPWINSLNARLTKRIGLISGHSVELAADFFNFVVFMTRQTSANEGVNFLTLCTATVCPGATTRYDNTLGRGVYVLGGPNYRQVQITPSRWRIQLGAKYTF